MAALTVLKFQTPEGASQMVDTLLELQKQQLITVTDTAVVTWPQGAKKPTTRQLVNMSTVGALDGAFWGILFGLIFFMPLIGLAIGAASGAFLGRFNDIGIDDDFIKATQKQVTEGTSALFLLSADAVLDRLAVEITRRGLHFELIASNLSQEQEALLRETFAA